MKRLALLLLALAACDDAPEGEASVPAAIPPGSIARGTSERLADIAAPGPRVTPALITAGAAAYRGYCASCHGVSGRGDGPVTEKGFPRSPPVGDGSHSPEQIVSIITNGQGLMPPLAEQLLPHRRWAIAHYLAREGGGGN